MTDPPPILDLVERFEGNIESYHSGKYNEAQLRIEFLDPFWMSLGWDMNNTAGLAEAYKEVIHEDQIRIGAATKAPDYSFRIGGIRKFFLEAKKPFIEIKHDPDSAYQLRRYGWSAKLPLSILSNFEEFAVYDCRIKPDKKDPASVARIFYCSFREYPTKWDEIVNIFSPKGILKGSFDKFVETTKRKRGTNTVDEEFLATIESWRSILARVIAIRNPKLDQRQLNYTVQSTIDRIIFLRICEDRGLEEYESLFKLVDEDNIYPHLCELFEEADARYNSGLFHFKKEKDRTEPPDELTLKLKIDDKPLREIIKQLYYPESPYEFSMISADILGQVYEQFLGKIIRLTPGHRAVIEEKPEVRKAGGVYYTPTYIVQYIVDNTVGKLLKDNTPKKIDNLKILDPACGSGSFLIEAYQYLLDWHLQWYMDNDPAKYAKGRNPAIHSTSKASWKLTINERKRILLNNIFGVDIDQQAVEVTKLSLLLKVLEGETQNSIQSLIKIYQERALPDLSRNIKCGNSIIGPDIYDGQQTSLLSEDEENLRINAFDWKVEFPDVKRAKGFDAVIGNPPYGAYLFENDKSYLATHYPHQTYQLDSYLIFLEKAIRDLVRENGLYGMIIPNPWLTNLRQGAIRKFVVQNSRVQEIVHFRFPVFPKVVVDTEIVLLQRANPAGWKCTVKTVNTLDDFLKKENERNIKIIIHQQQKWINLDGDVINIFTNQTEEKLASKCRSDNARLDSFVTINVGIKPYQVGKGTPAQTRRTVDERPYDSDGPITQRHRQYLRGTDIQRYLIAPVEMRYIKYGPWLAEPRPAANFDAPVKIVMRQTGDSLVAALDTKQLLCLNNMHVLVPKEETPSLEYLLGIINSRLLNWYYHILNPEVGETLAEVKKANVAQLPIRSIDLTNANERQHYDRLVAMVKQIISLHSRMESAGTDYERNNIQRQIITLDAQIDELVYGLYDLTVDEIKIIEEATLKKQ